MQHLDRYWETRFLDLLARAHTDLELAQIAAVSLARERERKARQQTTLDASGRRETSDRRGRWANEMTFEADLRVS